MNSNQTNYSIYQSSEDKIYFGKNRIAYNVIYEIGDVIDKKMHLFNDGEFVNIIRNKFSKYSIKDIELVKYKNVACFKNGEANINNAKEYFTEGFRYYFENYELLKETDIELFNYIDKIVGG